MRRAGEVPSRRRFSRSERSVLWLLSGGRCETCGVDLPLSWHADHVRAFVHGGPTRVENGQALCPSCNLKKGKN